MLMSQYSELQVGEKKRRERWWVNIQGLQKNHDATCRGNCILNWKREKGNAGKKTGRLTHRGSKVYLCIRCNVANSKTWHIPCRRFPLFLQGTRGFHDSLFGPNMENHMINGLSSTPRIAIRDSGKGQFNPHFRALCREKQVEYHCQNCGTAVWKLARFLPTRQEFNELTRS